MTTRTGIALLALGTLVLWSGHAVAADKAMIDEVKERGVLRVGVRNDSPAMGITDDKGQYQGFEIDLTADLAKRLGVKIEYVTATTQNRVPLLQQNRIDIIFGSASHYRARDRVLDFSQSYLRVPMTILTHKDSGIKSIADLNGKRIAADSASSAPKALENAGVKVAVQKFQGWPECVFALQQRAVDALVSDVVLLAGLRNAAPNANDFVLVQGVNFNTGYTGAMMRENDSKSRDAINFLLQDQWADGTWQKIFDKWLGANSPLKLTLADFGNFEMEVWQE